MRYVFLALVFFVASPDALAKKKREKSLPSPTEIIKKGEEQMRGKSAQSTLLMRIERPSYTRTLTLRSWSVGSEKALVEILEPSKEEGVSSLRVVDQMWNYLPKVDQIVRVPTSLMLQSWMGSDFTNDDLMKASSFSRDYHHQVVRTEAVKGEKAVLINCTPKVGAPVVWGKVQYWARVSDFLPLKQTFYDDRKKLVRTIEFSQFKKMDKRMVPTVLRVTKADTGEKTSVIYQKIVYDREIPEKQFEKDSIRSISQTGKVIGAGWFTGSKMR